MSDTFDYFYFDQLRELLKEHQTVADLMADLHSNPATWDAVTYHIGEVWEEPPGYVASVEAVVDELTTCGNIALGAALNAQYSDTIKARLQESERLVAADRAYGNHS